MPAFHEGAGAVLRAFPGAYDAVGAVAAHEYEIAVGCIGSALAHVAVDVGEHVLVLKRVVAVEQAYHIACGHVPPLCSWRRRCPPSGR